MNIYDILTNLIAEQLEYLSNRYEEEGDEGEYGKKYCEWIERNTYDITEYILTKSTLMNEVLEQINTLTKENFEITMENAPKIQYVFYNPKNCETIRHFDLDDMLDYLVPDKTVIEFRKLMNSEDTKKIDFIQSKGIEIFTKM